MIRWEVTLRGLRGFKAYVTVEAGTDPVARQKAIRLSVGRGDPAAWVEDCCQRPDTYPLTPAR